MGFRRSVLAQMIICGTIALLGPGLWVRHLLNGSNIPACTC